jgi:hypothetical protein
MAGRFVIEDGDSAAPQSRFVLEDEPAGTPLPNTPTIRPGAMLSEMDVNRGNASAADPLASGIQGAYNLTRAPRKVEPVPTYSVPGATEGFTLADQMIPSRRVAPMLADASGQLAVAPTATPQPKPLGPLARAKVMVKQAATETAGMMFTEPPPTSTLTIPSDASVTAARRQLAPVAEAVKHPLSTAISASMGVARGVTFRLADNIVDKATAGMPEAGLTPSKLAEGIGEFVGIVAPWEGIAAGVTQAFRLADAGRLGRIITQAATGGIVGATEATNTGRDPIEAGAVGAVTAGAITGALELPAAVRESNWFRMLTNKERGLVTQTMEDIAQNLKNNPAPGKPGGYTDAEVEAKLARIDPVSFQEALRKRMSTEQESASEGVRGAEQPQPADGGGNQTAAGADVPAGTPGQVDERGGVKEDVPAGTPGQVDERGGVKADVPAGTPGQVDERGGVKEDVPAGTPGQVDERGGVKEDVPAGTPGQVDERGGVKEDVPAGTPGQVDERGGVKEDVPDLSSRIKAGREAASRWVIEDAETSESKIAESLNAETAPESKISTKEKPASDKKPRKRSPAKAKTADAVPEVPVVDGQGGDGVPVVQPSNDLRPAVREGADTIIGAVGSTHPEIIEANDVGADHERGFVAGDGEFMTRDEAAGWLKENNPAVYDEWEKQNPGELHSQDLNAAVAKVEPAGIPLLPKEQKELNSLYSQKKSAMKRGEVFYDITSIIPLTLKELAKIPKASREAMPHLAKIGRTVFEEGRTKYQEFAKGMKEKLGELWDRFKSQMIAVYQHVVKTFKDERGLFAPFGGDIRDAKPPVFKKWFGDSKALDADGNPLVVNGYYVKSSSPPPIEPKGYKTGAALRARIEKESPGIDLSNIDEVAKAAEKINPEDFYSWTDETDMAQYSNPGAHVFFLSGLYGLRKPELAIGRRRKGLPWNGVSRNHADEGKREKGLSVINIVTPENEGVTTRYDAFNSDTKNILVWGFYPDQSVFQGSDGEPILVNAREIGLVDAQLIKPANLTKGQFTDLTDRKAKVEIDDSGARFMPEGFKPTEHGKDIVKAKLSDILHHPTLYKEYPYLANVDVATSRKSGSSFHNLDDGYISLGEGLYDPQRLEGTKELLAKYKEMQTRTDEIGKRSFKEYPGEYATEADAIKDRGEHVAKEIAKLEDEISTGNVYHPAELRSIAKTLLHEIQHALQERGGFAKGGSAAVDGGYRTYTRLSGEEEARRASARSDMTAAERMGTPYDRTDIANPKDLIVKMEGGRADSFTAKDRDEALKRHNEYLDRADDAVKSGDEASALKWLAKADEIGQASKAPERRELPPDAIPRTTGIKNAVTEEERTTTGKDPVEMLKELAKIPKASREAMPHLAKIGRTVFEEGRTKYDDFVKGMKEKLGDLWNRFKGIMEAVWENVKKTFNDERGSFSTKDQAEAIKRHNEYLDRADDAVKNRDEASALKWLAKADEIGQAGKAPERRELPPDAIPRTTGIKNAVTEEERTTTGKDPVEMQARRSFGAAFDSGKAAVDSGRIDPRQLAATLAEKPRALNAEECVALIYDRMRLRNDHAAVMENIEKAIKDKDAVAELENRQRLSKIEDDINTNDEAARRTGYEQGLGLAIRRMMIAEDYTLARSIQRARVAIGKALPAEIRAKIEDLTKQLQEALKKSEDYEAKLAAIEAQRKVQKVKNEHDESPARKRREHRAETRDELEVQFKSLAGKLRAKLGRLNINFDPEDVAILGEMMKIRVQEGMTKAKDIIDDIYEELSDIEDVSKRDIQDAISNYGKSYKVTQEELAVEMRELRRQMRLMSALEDAESGTAPLHSGRQRDPVSDEVRDLQRQIKDAMRESGLDAQSTKDQAALDAIHLKAYKTRTEKQIADLKRKLETGDFEKSARWVLKMDPEAERLKVQAGKLKEQIDAFIHNLERQNRTELEKYLEFQKKAQRGAIFSSLGVIWKIGTSAVVWRPGFSTLEQGIGNIWRLAPPIRMIYDGAPRHGSGLSIRAEAAGYVQLLKSEMYRNFWDRLKQGKDGIQIKYAQKKKGELAGWGITKLEHAEYVLDFPGRAHSALKSIAYIQEFYKSLQYRVEGAMRNNWDMTDEKNKFIIFTAAEADANTAQLMADNVVNNIWRSGIGQLKKRGPGGQVAASLIEAQEPVMKVPLNAVGETFSYIPPIGAAKALAQLAAGYMRSGKTSQAKATFGKAIGEGYREAVRKMTEQEKEYFARTLNKAGLGIFLFAIGYALHDEFGRFYKRGEKRKVHDLKPGEARIFGINVPESLMHFPGISVIQAGAMVHHVDNLVQARENKKEEKAAKRNELYERNDHGIAEGIQEAGLGIAEEIPFVGTPLRLHQAAQSYEGMSYYSRRLLESLFLPSSLPQLARKEDKFGGEIVVPRKGGISQDIPGLRQTLPLDINKVKRMQLDELAEIMENAPSGITDEIRPIFASKFRRSKGLSPEDRQRYVDILK